MQPIPASLEFVKYLIEEALPIGEHKKTALGKHNGEGIIVDLTDSFHTIYGQMKDKRYSDFSHFMTSMSIQGKSPLVFQFNQRSVSGPQPSFAAITPTAFRIEDEHGKPIQADDNVIVRGQLGAHGEISTLECIVSKKSTARTKLSISPVPKIFNWER